MTTQYTISQLARAVGVPTTTLRYYERIALLRPEDRTGANYRLYGDESLRRVRFVRAAQAIGFALDDIRALLGERDDTTLSCREVQALIEARLSDVEKRLKDLRHVQRALKTTLAKCQESEGRVCYVMDSLRSKLTAF